ncbi:MAG TPA: uracil-DNA glycosylase, partial [Anaerolineae bacterium]|nr:uracil-DNA glycosylase [Anaerolineae bacterium]
SYLLRNQSKAPGSPKSLMWEDIKEIRKKYDELMST